MAVNIPEGYAVLSLQMALTGDDEPMYCTFGVDIASNDPEDVAAGGSQGWGAAWKALLPSVYSLTEVVCTTADEIGASSAQAGAGQRSISAGPQNVAYLAKKVTSRRGRENQGRFFIPGVNRTGVQDNGFLTSGELSAMQGLVNTFFNELTEGPLITGAVVLHSNPSTVPTPVSAFTIDPMVSTQRRRLR